MGAGGSAISNTEVINYNDFVVDQSVRNRITQDCIVGLEAENVLRITGSKIRKLTTDQSNIIKNLCILQTMIRDTRDAAASQELMTKIAKEIEAKGGLPGTGGYSESISKLYNRLAVSVDQSTINDISKNCIMDQRSSNVMEIFDSDIEGADLVQVNKTFSQCLQNYGEVREIGADLLNRASTELDESVRSSGLNFNLFASIFIPILIIGYIALRFFRII